MLNTNEMPVSLLSQFTVDSKDMKVVDSCFGSLKID